MRAHDADPVAGTTGRQDHRGEHRDVTPLPESLPPHLIERLRANGVNDGESWLALGRKRLFIFGVTKKHCAEIDSAVRALAVRALAEGRT